ncbi:hypothetical protein RUND412_000979 [Rhizina undulata]
MSGYYYQTPSGGYAVPRAAAIQVGDRIAVPIANIQQIQAVPAARPVYLGQQPHVVACTAEQIQAGRPVHYHYAAQAPAPQYYAPPAVAQPQPIVVNNAAIPNWAPPPGIPEGSRIVKIPRSSLPQMIQQPATAAAPTAAAVVSEEERRLDALIQEDKMAREQMNWYHTRRPISPTNYLFR